MAALFTVIALMAIMFLPSPFTMQRADAADPGLMKWESVQTPGSFPGRNDAGHLGRCDILNPQFPLGADSPKGSEIIDMAAGNDGKSVTVAVRTWVSDNYSGLSGRIRNVQLFSNDNGISWEKKSDNIFQVIPTIGNPNYLTALVGGSNGPKIVLRSTDGGAGWDTIFDGKGLDTDETIRFADVSPNYTARGGSRQDIGLVTCGGSNGGRWIVRSSGDYSQASVQINANGSLNQLGENTTSGIDYLAIRFSPNYQSDGSIALVYADNTSANGGATWYNIAYRDLDANTTQQFAFPFPGVEVRDPASAPGASPNWSQLNNVDLQLPSDFTGTAASLRRAYISLDAYGSGGINPDLRPKPKNDYAQDGIFRIDDATPYVLMDTSGVSDKSIYTIAYYGTYASGKLLAGERLGYPCTATVPVWFTDSPTTCPIPCWYPALKPPTGAGNPRPGTDNKVSCELSAKTGLGAAIVDWSADGSLAFAATGSLPCTVYANQTGYIGGAGRITDPDRRLWYQMQFFDCVPNDESALSISRNNGETWNQVSIIDTTIDWFNDVVASPDCTTLYLASVNRNKGIGCSEFDSVWRSTLNPYVAAPLPCIPPIGSYWERVLTRPSSGSCNVTQTDLPILRSVPSCSGGKDGPILAWAAQGATASGSSGGVMAWSPDYGDFWAPITPRYPVQDFAFESATQIYALSAGGLVQSLPYSGTSWSTNLPSYQTDLESAHTIAVVPEGKILVGAGAGASYPVAYSPDKGKNFTTGSQSIPGHGNQHVTFDVDFKDNSFIYMGDDSAGGLLGAVYRNTVPAFARWEDGNLMSHSNGCGYVFDNVTFSGLTGWPANGVPPHPVGQFGLVQAWTGNPQPALYSAHDNITTTAGTYDSAVCRTLTPRDGLPKPGIYWDCLDIYRPPATAGVKFTLEPSSLKACGCCTLDSPTTLYAIDDQSGNWLYTSATARNYDSKRLSGRFNGDLFKPPMPGYTPSRDKGLLWTYTDCLAKKAPVLKGPAEGYLVGADPVSGRNQQVDLAWEQLCLSTAYQLQVAKDKDFTRRINPAVSNAGSVDAVTGAILIETDEVNMTSPAAWLAPGALPEAGDTYWWRIRSARSATGQLAASPWSAARSFSVRPGFITASPYYGLRLLSPTNGCIGCPVQPVAFTWSPYKEATLYRFELATDTGFRQIVVGDNTTATAYQFSGGLNYSTNFFWRVRALQVNGRDMPGDWSAAFAFRTADDPTPVVPPATPPPAKETPNSDWVWAIFAIGAIVVSVLLIFIMPMPRD